MNVHRTRIRTNASNPRNPKVRPRTSPRLGPELELVVAVSFTAT